MKASGQEPDEHSELDAEIAKDLELDARAADVRGGNQPRPGEPVPIPYPNTRMA